MSLINGTNNNGERCLPCGTPDDTSIILDFTPNKLLTITNIRAEP